MMSGNLLVFFMIEICFHASMLMALIEWWDIDRSTFMLLIREMTMIGGCLLYP